MRAILWGNLISLVGAVIMVLVGLIKKKRNILLAQAVQNTALAVGNLFLGALTGALNGFVTVVRNLICLKWEFTLYWKLAFTAIQAVLSLAFNNAGFYGWLPFAATCAFTWCLDTKREEIMKLVIIFGAALWAVYDFHFLNFTTLAFDLFTIASNAVGIYMLKKAR